MNGNRRKGDYCEGTREEEGQKIDQIGKEWKRRGEGKERRKRR